ncbi:sigma-70 family RNA polymerase sigma factor, partial [Leptolyngbya sp. FACHB-36]|nr:sigma-70 family RNA polymerase sigma factor [Leptolyngbya sp. FACHB-36]
MNPRQSVTELFSTFIEFVDDRFSRWGSDRTLRQNMLCCLKQLETRVSDDYWVLYWYKHWQQQPKSIAEQHLSAYLQEPCYWAAQRMTSRQTGVQYRVSDCFQRAIVEVPTVLSGYSPHQAASLRTYASLCFGNVMRDMLRQQREADSRTDWGLLRKLSQKRLTESLQMSGLSADTIACYRLA